MKRIKYILLGMIVLSILVIIVFNIIKNNDNFVVDEYKKDYYIGEGWHELVLEVAKKNNDWTGLPLSKKFRKKYNSKDGILGKIEFDTVELNPFSAKDNYIGTMCHLLIKNGKRQSAYIYWQKYDNNAKLLDDVELVGPIDMFDENGKALDYRLPFVGKTKLHNVYQLIRGNIYETGVAVTDKFHKKYPFFLDLFIHYSPLSYNEIEFLKEESDLDNNIAVFEVNSILECKKRKYEVKLIFDDKQYLDDAEVKFVKEEDYRGNSENTSLKILFKNSNWDSIKVTNKYKNKINGNSFINEIDDIDIDYFSESKTVGNREYIRKYRMVDGNYSFYHIKYYFDGNELIDDVNCVKLDYDSTLTLDEVLEKFLIQE